MNIKSLIMVGISLGLSTAVNAASLITSTDVTLLNLPTIIDQNNTLLNQFPTITQPSVNQSAVLVSGSTVLGSSSLQVDLAAGSFKVFADSSFPSTATSVITSTVIQT